MSRRLVKLLLTLSSTVLLAVACSGEGTGTSPVAEPAEPAAAPDAVSSATSVPTPAPAGREGPPARAAGGDNEAAATEPEAIAAAHRLIGEMVQAYRAAPAFVDRIVIETSIAGNKRPDTEALVRLGPGTDMWMRTTNNELVVIDGMLYMTYAKIPDKYIAVPLQEDALTTLVALFGRYGGTMASCVLRYGKPPPRRCFHPSIPWRRP